MNRHTLLDVYLGLKIDALRVVTGALMLTSAGGAAEANIGPEKEASQRPGYHGTLGDVPAPDANADA